MSEACRPPVARGEVLAVCTSCARFYDGTPTGLWLSELAEPYYHFREQGYDVTIASPAGGPVPLDPASLAGDAVTGAGRRFQADAEASQQLQHSVPLSSVTSGAGYDCIFLPGGHGPVYDLVDNETLGRLLADADSTGKVIAAVCHGPAGLLSASRADGAPLVAGRRVTGFTGAEERGVGKDKIVPWALDAKLAQAGAQMVTAPAPFQAHVVTDGRLITGQNPASALPLAQAAVRAMRGGAE